jgi:hypothetical protein
VLPSRILDIDNDRISLVETKGEEGKYIALSWCWGKVNPPKTTTTNLQQRIQNIPLFSLPATFRDAIVLTRRLGIRYLWIDSLCILQDSAQDWEYHAAWMTQIYSHAWLTLCAAASSNAEEGLFRQPESTSIGPIRLNGTANLTGNEDIFVRRESFHNPLYSVGNKYQLAQNWIPLLYRGWAFQEYLLATRVAHFTAVEVVFECSHHIICECRSGNHTNFGQKAKFYSAIRQKEIPTLLTLWESIATSYSTRSLTEPADKLPALSGIANVFQRVIGSNYLAGLWEVELLDSLYWWAYADGGRPSCYIAPSWSWASIPYAVEFSFPVRKFGDQPGLRYLNEPTKVLSVECITSSNNPTGRVSSGALRISGPVLECRYKFTEDTTYKKNRFRTHFCLIGDTSMELIPDYLFERDPGCIKEREPLLCMNVSPANTAGRYVLRPVVFRLKTHIPPLYERVGAVHWNKNWLGHWANAEIRSITVA